MVSKLALGGIWVYQRLLSPRKGFRCAHAVRYGGTGCSGYVKLAIRDRGLWTAWPDIRRRFRDCRAAHLAIRAECLCNERPPEPGAADPTGRARKKKRKGSTCANCASGVCDCTTLPGFCGSGAARGGSSRILDTNPCDGDGCGLDCGGADCLSCDCGGCSCG